MAAPKLSDEQLDQLNEWLAADYSTYLIRHWMQEQEWPVITHVAISYHRKKNQAEIDRRREARRDSALNTGLAVKEERVERLKEHADRLEPLKWIPDEKGKLHNEKAWRETLGEIALEVGDRRQGVDATLTSRRVKRMTDDELIASTEAPAGGDVPAGTAATDEPT